MTIMLNGEPHECQAQTLAQLLAALQLEDAAVATALNGSFVRKRERDAAKLTAGDAVEILAAMQGG